MAKITPYGDPNAHGSLGDSLTFRRVRGGVVLERKPHPKDVKSVAQLAQRALFVSAQSAWYQYDVISKPWIEARATQLGLTARNLFTRASLLNKLPVVADPNNYGVTSLQMTNPTGRTSGNTTMTLYCYDPGVQNWVPHGSLDIDTNIWTKAQTSGQLLTFFNFAFTTSMPFAFRDGFAMTYEDENHNMISGVVRAPGPWVDLSQGVNTYAGLDFTLWGDMYNQHWITENNF